MSRYQESDRIQPKHGEEVDVNGTPCLWLDSGTRKGVWLSPKSAACVLANEDKLRIFIAKHQAKKTVIPEEVVKVVEEVKAEVKAKDTEISTLQADRENLKAQIEALKATLGKRNGAIPTTAVQRFNPVAP